MSTTRKTPKLRFPEFTDDWEQRKLGDITDSFSGGTPKVGNEEYYGGEIPFIRSAEINSSTTELYITKKGLDNSSAKMVSKGTILYALYGATSGECGISQIDGAINQAILAIKPKCGYVPYFISTWLRRSKFSIVSTFLQGGQGNLSGEIVKNLSLMLPCQNEQKKIGELFKKLDSTITLHQRELDSLKKLKKSLLQKMFPKNGEKIPELRFPEFTGDWEQRKVNSLIEEFSEKTTQNNQYPVLTSSRKGIFLQTDYFSGNQVASIDNTGYNIVPKGYFTYRHMSDDEIFYFNINDIVDRGIVSTLYPVFKAKDKVADSYFLRYVLNYGEEFRKYAILQKQGGSRTYMYLKKLKELELTIPHSFDEQVVISTFLLKIDNIITLHQRELDTLKKLKKGLLQNMFV